MEFGQGITFSALASQLLVGLSRTMVLFIVSAGLSFILGVLRVPNIAHGSLYMIGAFSAYTIATDIETLKGEDVMPSCEEIEKARKGQ